MIEGLNMHDRFHVYCCARTVDSGRLQADLASSPEIAGGRVGLTVLWNQVSASSAYAHAMETSPAEIVIFAHCDVYFPEGWFKRLAWEVDRLSQTDDDWAVAGISSVTSSGEGVGRIYDSSLAPGAILTVGSEVFGKTLAAPVPIISADELVLVVRRKAGVPFDPSLPEFHLYGTDIVLEAEKRGKRSYGFDMPLIHNSKAHVRFQPDYSRAYKYMVRKWRSRLPVPTTCGTLTATPLALSFRRLRLYYWAFLKSSTYSTQRIDSRTKAMELGFDRLLAAPMLDQSSRIGLTEHDQC